MNEQTQRETSASSASRQLRDKASGLAQGAKEQARAQYDEKKEAAVGELSTLASALHRAVSEMSENNPGNMSGKVVATIADRIESFSRDIEGKDLDQVMSGIDRFARRNPAAFLGGAVALGFLAARFLKSSGDSYAGAGGGFYSSEAYGGFRGGRGDSAIGSTGFSGGVGVDTPGTTIPTSADFDRKGRP
jgi:hypothetical protein